MLAACGGDGPVKLPGIDEAPAEAGSGKTSETAGIDTVPAPNATTDEPPLEADPAIEEANAAALNQFFERTFQESVLRSPTTQTYLGIKQDYDKWDDVSPEAALKEREFGRRDHAEMLQRFGDVPLTDNARLSYRLADYQHNVAEQAFEYRDYGYVFDQMNGEQSSIPAFLINQHQITSKSDAEAYIARLVALPAYINQHLANARAAANKGIRPPQFTYAYVQADAQNVITGYPWAAESEGDSPLYKDFKTKATALHQAGSITDEELATLLSDAETALLDHVRPAFLKIIDFSQNESLEATTDDGAWKLPNGEAYYAARLAQMTTTDMTATQIHDLGLAEVARIHDEMRAIMTTVGFEGNLKAFFEDLRTNPKFYKPNDAAGRDEYLNEATELIDTMKTALPDYFDTFPKADLIVKAVEPFREKSAGKAFYSRPAPDGSRPGTYYANLYNMADMPIYQMEALAYHEGIPGHHMQLAISQELTGVPNFRKYFRATAYTEGWGLYSEWLPKQMGFYQDPYSDAGRLAMELWRAARLVVDTGIHDKKWTREEAIQYLMDNTPNPEGDARKAIERYIVMPGQATAYKIGMNKIIELRELAQTELGDGFDDGWFHDRILEDGPMPLAMLEEKLVKAIADKKAG